MPETSADVEALRRRQEQGDQIDDRLSFATTVQTGWTTPELEEQVRRFIPLGGVGTPEEIADGSSS